MNKLCYDGSTLKNIVTRKSTLEEDDGSFDREFWSKISPSDKMQRTYELSMMLPEIQQGKKIESRLQRHVVNIERE